MHKFHEFFQNASGMKGECSDTTYHDFSSATPDKKKEIEKKRQREFSRIEKTEEKHTSQSTKKNLRKKCFGGDPYTKKSTKLVLESNSESKHVCEKPLTSTEVFGEHVGMVPHTSTQI